MRTSHLPRVILGAAVMAAVLFGLHRPASAATIIDVAGTTLGCFDVACTPDSGAISPADYDLTFASSSFALTTDAFGDSGAFALGTLTRGNTNTSDDTDPLSFILEVAFTMPVGIGSGNETFTTTIEGTNHGGGGALDVDFDTDWRELSFSNAFGSGSFEFAVLQDLLVHKNGSATIIGGIRNATFTPNPSGPIVPAPPQPVPEPSALLLLGLGLAAASRRRA